MDNKFSDMSNNSMQLYSLPNEDMQEINQEEFSNQYGSYEGEDELHFSIDNLLNSEYNPNIASLFKSILLTIIATGLTYGGMYFFRNTGIAKNLAKKILGPLAAGTGILGTKSLNEIFGYLVAKIKGLDVIEEVHLEVGNESMDFVNRIENKFDKDRMTKTTYINEDPLRRH